MKKLLLYSFSILLFISCSKEELELNNYDELNSTVEDCAAIAGPDNSVDLTIAQIQSKYYSVSRLKNLFSSLLGNGVDRKGIFSPTIEQLALQYSNATNKIGAYSTTYTVTEGDCSDSAVITVNIVEECNINAGADHTSTVLTLAEVETHFDAISRVKNLYESLIADGVDRNGTFSPSIEEIGKRYLEAEDKRGVYSTTYTIGEGNCTDSAELAITIISSADDTCEAYAGDDNSLTLTVNQINSRYNSVSRLEILFNKLLSNNVDPGTFNPSIEELAMQYTSASVKTGTYSTTYQVGDKNCSDSAVISIVVEN